MKNPTQPDIGCIECEHTWSYDDEEECPMCGSNRLIKADEAFYVALGYYHSQLIKNPEDLELIREDWEADE